MLVAVAGQERGRIVDFGPPHLIEEGILVAGGESVPLEYLEQSDFVPRRGDEQGEVSHVAPLDRGLRVLGDHGAVQDDPPGPAPGEVPQADVPVDDVRLGLDDLLAGNSPELVDTRDAECGEEVGADRRSGRCGEDPPRASALEYRLLEEAGRSPDAQERPNAEGAG